MLFFAGTAASTSRTTRRRSAKPVDPPYRPDAAATASSDEGTPRTRARSKGKGRSSLGARAPTALSRGVQEAEVWYGKKPQGRKGVRRSGEGVGREEEEEDDDDDDERVYKLEPQDDEQDLGGMDQHEHYTAGDRDGSYKHDQDGDGDATPPAASYFLRVGSPSPAQSGAASPRQQSGQPSNLGRSPSPFYSNVGASTSGAARPVDPAFAAFDRSIGAGSNGRDLHGDGHSLSASFDDSVLRGSSYDFSEEERIVQALEAQKQRQLEAQQARARQLQQLRQAPPPPTPGGVATPMPSTGAYPLTPQAAGASPVSAMRKRRLPGPPSMLGAGTPLGAQDDDDEDDGAAGGLAREGKWGRRCGDALRPFVRVVERVRSKAQDPLLDWAKIRRALGALLLASALIIAVWCAPLFIFLSACERH